MKHVVAIVGRPNVGKSTLFNRLVGRRQAITDDVSGVTRDRHYGEAEWNGIPFAVIDTGGYVADPEEEMEKAVQAQVNLSLEEADIILFMVDCRAGMVALDEEFANHLRKISKPVIVVANKADDPGKGAEATEFYSLGFENLIAVSSQTGSGTGDMLDEVVSFFSHEPEDELPADIPKVAILGRPNVGKSSFLNVLLGRERSIVTGTAGTTRDSIHSRYTLYGKDYLLVDTAGLRKRSRVHEDIEFYSVRRAIRSMEDADVCIVLLDAERGVESQDLNIVSLVHRYKKGLIVLVNKWDTVEKETRTAQDYDKWLRERFAPVDYMPVLFVSVHEKKRILKAMEKVGEVYENMKKRIPSSQLNDIMLKETNKNPPPAVRGRPVKIKYITQLPTRYPSFAFFCNYPESIREPYRRFLENRMRQNFDFTGVPLTLYFRKK